MNAVALSVTTREAVTRRAERAFAGRDQGSHISFASVDLLWQTMTRKRWELLKALTGQEAVSIREASRLVERDVKSVHGDAHALLEAGVIQKTAECMIIFPYDAVHVDFMLTSAA